MPQIATTPKDAMIHARTDSKLKKDVEAILKKLGISTSEAINLFYSQIRMRKGIPFDISIPNDETRKAMKEIKEGKGTRYTSVDDFFKKMGV